MEQMLRIVIGQIIIHIVNIQTGLNFYAEHELWNASVSMNREIMKSFPTIQSCGYQEAKQKAYEWCQQKFPISKQRI